VASAAAAAGLIDTDILIDAFHNLPAAVAFLAAQQSASGVTVSIITAMELVAGCRNSVELSQLQNFLRQLTVLPVSPTVSLHAYQFMESFSLSHGLTIADALIAATTIDQSLVLYTRNVRHFQMIPGLVVVPPY
jgi:predicted nucleic acid-binding protein